MAAAPATRPPRSRPPAKESASAALFFFCCCYSGPMGMYSPSVAVYSPSVAASASVGFFERLSRKAMRLYLAPGNVEGRRGRVVGVIFEANTPPPARPTDARGSLPCV